ncbi:sn-1-specific diacylglycerol lipase ABHD11-like isoform X2 [Parasteatoda tepidariorum]|uniref:sn-1-specific diacylglycerol lipase ABHD11-like isoform X2 n=1 Tax=Parasteatoda tepidariorum TaxID=114398 RepID=UPI00077F9C6E|nr:protein ABHD11-like isoform X2 [Parasteatoda tepidariorum]
MKMKPLKAILCLTVLLEISNCVFSEPLRTNTTEPLHLAHTCLRITLNGQKDDRAPILLVHGFLGFQGMYMDLMHDLALKTARKVCTVDLRNHGDSPWSNDTDLKAMASDLPLLMKTLDTDKLVILGHSLGGKIAVDFTLTYPEKVEKLIVEDMRPNGLSEEVQKRYGGNLDYLRDALRLIPEGANEDKAKKRIVSFYNSLLKLMDKTLSYDEKFVDYIPIKFSDSKWKWKANLDVLDKLQADPVKHLTIIGVVTLKRRFLNFFQTPSYIQ